MESVFKFWQHVEDRVQHLMPTQVFPAVVKEVDEDLRTCTVRINDNVDFEDVRLYAVIDDSLSGFCLIPAIDSTVLVARIANGNDLYVVSFSEVDKILGTMGDKTEISLSETEFAYTQKGDAADKNVTLKIADGKVTVDAKTIEFNGGENIGLLTTKELTTKINELVDTFNDHTHTIESISVPGTGLAAPTGGGTVTGSATAANVSVPAPDSSAKKLNENN